ncbi:hypothetical protein [Candidatus Berkiella aquae]|uniref:Uncharacterized protein n=1 Tax=Candidatus Berkiella aquae TaxID=295108 RepID=A0A0Q9YK41_9GAMM|nr:hypothetical protein [Candidatus Berkiella aquae]MCS5709993.1 hypothetical protein [Candidatus Berkiella aquae]
MVVLEESEWGNIAGGNVLFIQSLATFSLVYTSLAKVFIQKEVTLFEATAIYQQLGHRLGEFFYTTFHPIAFEET